MAGYLIVTGEVFVFYSFSGVQFHSRPESQLEIQVGILS